MRAAALFSFLVAFWCFVYGRTTPDAWQTPIHYEGDTVSFLAYLKAARDGHVVPVAATYVSDLNAPYGANWNDYPRPQKAFFWLAGRVARAIGVFPTANLLLLLAHLWAGLAFYGVARYLRCRSSWAAALAVAFAASPFIFYRGLSHLALSLYWHIPLDILVVGWCFRRRGLDVQSRQFCVALLVALTAALFNVYYAALFVQFLGLSALAQLARRNPRRAVAPMLLAAALVSLFTLESLGTLRYPATHGPNPAAVDRSYGDLERFALKPIELVLPLPGHGLLHYGDLARDGYWQSARGEVGSAYLGLAAIAGVASVLAVPVVALLMRRRVFITPALGALVWILAFSVAGGINGVLGSLGVVLFRGTNRYSIWIAALGLLVLGGKLSRSTTGRRGALALAPLLLTVLVLVDQTPGILSREGVAAQFRQLQKDRAFAERIEATLAGRPMIYMLPVLDFPENGPVRGMPDYDHFRSYLFTSRVRYSYGSDKGRAREEWQHRVEAMAPPKMVARLEEYGFSGVLVDRRAYADGGERLLAGFTKAGRRILFDEEGGGRAFVRLNPRPEPRLPDAAPRLGEGWFGRAQAEGVWARSTEAQVILDNSNDAPRLVRLSFELTVAKPRKVVLYQAGRSLASWEPDPTVSVDGLEVVLAPGESRLVFGTDQPAALVEVGNRMRMATFAVKDLEMKEE